MILTFLITFIISSFFLVNPLQVFSQSENQTVDTLSLEEFACKAYDPASLKGCIEQIKTTKVPIVKIEAPIICESGNDCSFNFEGINSDTYIFSSKPENKIIRRGDFGYTLFSVMNSSGLKFTDTVFEDEGNGVCPTATVCPELFLVKNSNDIKLDKIQFKNTRGNSLFISDSGHIDIRNSSFSNSYAAAIKVASAGLTENIIIVENNFISNAGNAIVFQSQSSANSPSIIGNNTFSNNHSQGSFSNCTYPCVGSQINVASQTSNLSINKNKIRGGFNTVFDLLGLYSSGIQISSDDIGSVRVYCNEISGNRGSGIVQSSPTANVTPITIDKNKIWGNGLNLNIPVSDIKDTNCFNESCSLSCS